MAASGIERRCAAWLACVLLAGLCLWPGARGAGAQEKGWRVYKNDAYGFSVKYPNNYVILRERGAEPGESPRALARLRLQERRIAAGQFADLEPPQFSVEVFDAAGGKSLREWLEAAGWLSEGDDIEPAELEGAREGLRVRMMAQMAPNEFYFYRTDRRVFRVIPLGEHGRAVLDSFRLTPERAGAVKKKGRRAL